MALTGKRILVSDQPLLHNPSHHIRCVIADSSVQNRNRILSADGSKVLAVDPFGNVLWSDAAQHDGGYEAAQIVGNRAIYDYPDMKPGIAPVVWDVVVLP